MTALPLVFASPWVLLALAALPILWWLLRVPPPAPRREAFPAIRLLLGLTATAETPARTPWWLLALRILAAALVIVRGGAAGAGRRRAAARQWAFAAGDRQRLGGGDRLAAPARRGGRRCWIAPSGRDGRRPCWRPPRREAGTPPQPTPAMPVSELRPRLAALRPQPWSTDRAAAAAALHDQPQGSVVYIADGLTDGAGWDAFSDALTGIGPVTELTSDTPVRLLLPPRAPWPTGWWRAVARLPLPIADAVPVLAQAGDGRTLARVTAEASAPGVAAAEAPISLPPELRNRLTRLVLEGSANAGSVVLLDERWRRRPVGLLAGDAVTASTPLTGERCTSCNARWSRYSEGAARRWNTLLSRARCRCWCWPTTWSPTDPSTTRWRTGWTRAACWCASPGRRRPSIPTGCCR